MLLDVRGLTTHFSLEEGLLRAVDDVSFEIGAQETVALVGESGCGKTIVALSIINLVPRPGAIVSGCVQFKDTNLVSATRDELRAIRGRSIGMVFQEPGASLNPVYPIGAQIAEVVRAHLGGTKAEARRSAVRLLGDVGMPEPERCARMYPFELSGGMCQRAAIAIAIAAGPALLIADEPTTALDVTVQAEIVDLLRYLQDTRGMAILLITHDLGVVAEMAQRILVMYTGKIVESSRTDALFADARHPYTRGLLGSILRLGGGRESSLGGIPGSVPDLLDLPPGCTFHPRCPIAEPGCAAAFPPLLPNGDGRACACYKAHAH